MVEKGRTFVIPTTSISRFITTLLRVYQRTLTLQWDDMAFLGIDLADFIREFDFTSVTILLQSSHNTVWVYTMPVIALA